MTTLLDGHEFAGILTRMNARWNNEVSIPLGRLPLGPGDICLASLDWTTILRVRANQRVGPAYVRRRASADRKPGENLDLWRAPITSDYRREDGGADCCCCRLGARYAGAEPAVCEALTRYGYNIGVAFQIADDVLDMVGEESHGGQVAGHRRAEAESDAAADPAVEYCESLGPGRIDVGFSHSDNHRRDVLRPWFERYDAIPYSRERARSYTRQACREWRSCPPRLPAGSLSALADFVVESASVKGGLGIRDLERR